MPNNFNQIERLTVYSNDAGNSGQGGPLSDTDTHEITVGFNLNDAPINKLPAPIVTDTTSILLSATRGNQLAVSDIDAGEATDFRTQLYVDTGTLSLVDTAGVTVVGVGTINAPLLMIGTKVELMRPWHLACGFPCRLIHR